MTLPNNLSSVIKTLTSKGYAINHVFDIGANKGTWTAHYQKELPKAQFYLFEANPAQQQPKNLAPKNKWFNVVLSNPETTEVTFYSISGTGDSYYKEQTHHYDNCKPLVLKTTTLDDTIEKYSLPHPQLIKLDTQGSELDILDGAKTIIDHVDIIVTEIAVLQYNDGAPSFEDYMDSFTYWGYVPVGVEKIHIADNIVVQMDMVFLKRNIKNKYYGDKNIFTNTL